jgi:hypothetical protein
MPQRALLWSAAAAAIVGAAWRVLFLSLSMANAGPFWYWEPLTLSEAAALRDAAEVARQLKDGQDPNRAYRVRGGMLYQDTRQLTPMQAAVKADRPEIIDLLHAGGALDDPPDAAAQ